MARMLRLVAGVALVLAACTSDGTTTSNAEPTDAVADSSAPGTSIPESDTTASGGSASPELSSSACQLVEDAEVSAFLGVDVTGEPGPLSGQGARVADCFWIDPGTGTSFSIQYFGDGRQVSATDFAGLFETEPLGGIGDEAITLADDTGRFNSVWAQSGQFIVACYPDPLSDDAVVIDGAGWDVFFSLCETALSNASG